MRALALALAVSVPATAAVDASARPQGPLAPADGVLLGAFSAATRIPPVYTRPELARSLAWLESAAGRKLDIYHYYYRFWMRFPTTREREWGAQDGRIPLISWGGAPVGRIADGGEDRTIAARADDVRRYKRPIFIRWFWEMDGAERQPTAGEPAEFIAAWRRIVTTFRARGASNAVFVWCPNAWGFETGRAQRYYPGDDYVDWICADGYNWAPVRPRSRWTHFSDTFAVWYRWAAARNKPLMIGETGAMERRAGEREAWIDRLRADLKRMPAIGALVYFDTWDKRGYDWRLRTSDGARAAWRRLGQDPALRVSRPAVRDGARPRIGIAAAARGRVVPGTRTLKGSVLDPKPSAGLLRVEVALRLVRGGACLDAVGGRWRPVSCSAVRAWLPARRVAGGWRRATPAPRGSSLRIAVRATDIAGNVSVLRRSVSVRG